LLILPKRLVLKIDDDKYEIIVRNKLTKKEVSVVQLRNDTGYEQWQKIVASHLAFMLNLSGSAKVRFLVFLLGQKDEKNRVYGNYKQLGNQSGVSIGTVKSLMPKLKENSILRELTSHVYMVNPEMIRPGHRYKGAVLFDIWEDC